MDPVVYIFTGPIVLFPVLVWAVVNDIRVRIWMMRQEEETRQNLANRPGPYTVRGKS